MRMKYERILADCSISLKRRLEMLQSPKLITGCVRQWVLMCLQNRGGGDLGYQSFDKCSQRDTTAPYHWDSSVCQNTIHSGNCKQKIAEDWGDEFRKLYWENRARWRHWGPTVEPSLWNSVPAALRRPEMTLHTFKRQLKICLFHIRCVDQQKWHRLALLWRFCNSGIAYTPDLLTCICPADDQKHQPTLSTVPAEVRQSPIQ